MPRPRMTGRMVEAVIGRDPHRAVERLFGFHESGLHRSVSSEAGKPGIPPNLKTLEAGKTPHRGYHKSFSNQRRSRPGSGSGLALIEKGVSPRPPSTPQKAPPSMSMVASDRVGI